MLAPTEKLRFLNKACIITNHEDLKPDGSASNPWRLCTIEQVEELKSLLKVIPMWSTGIILALTISQQSFPIIQANTMDRHITSYFQIPAASLNMFMIGSLIIWIALYDCLILPRLVKLTGKPYGLGVKQRMGIGIVLSCIAMAVSAVVENARRKTAIKQGFIDNPEAVLDMSAMWLVPQYCLFGLAEAFSAVAQTEFFYTEFPKSISGIATALFGLGMGFGSLISGALVNAVDGVTKKGGKESWVSSNLNRGHYDYYCWLLTVLSVFNFIYFLVCSWSYGLCEGETTDSKAEGEGLREELLSKS